MVVVPTVRARSRRSSCHGQPWTLLAGDHRSRSPPPSRPRPARPGGRRWTPQCRSPPCRAGRSEDVQGRSKAVIRACRWDVLVHQNFPEAHRASEPRGQLGREDVVRTDHPHRVGVVPGRPPPLGRADVLRDVNTTLDRGDERVLHPAQPQRVGPPPVVGRRFLAEHGQVVGHRPQQPQHPDLIDHAARSRRSRGGCGAGAAARRRRSCASSRPTAPGPADRRRTEAHRPARSAPPARAEHR